MAEIRQAILTGTMEAARAHDELGSRARWEQSGGRIDVFGAIDHFGLPLMFRPLDGLLGAYIVDPSPGIMVSTKRPLSVRRYTAAHELGHHRLDHKPSVDDEAMLARTPFASRVTYDQQEVAADAFATAFLLPIWFVSGHMQRYGWRPADMREPANVYQMALRSGTSYEATCYALRNHRVVDHVACDRLLSVQPKVIKQALVPQYVPASWHLDVWSLKESDNGAFIEASIGDVLQIALAEHSGGGYRWDVGGIDHSDWELVGDGRERGGQTAAIGGHVVRKVTARARTEGMGSIQFVERRPWEKGSPPLAAYGFSYDVQDTGVAGLLKRQLERMAGGLQ